MTRSLLLGTLLLLLAIPAHAQWDRVDTGMDLPRAYVPGFVTTDDSYVYAHMLLTDPAESLLLRSADEGKTWEPLSGFTPVRGNLALFANLDGLLFAAGPTATGSGAAFYLSSDQGMNWTTVDPGIFNVPLSASRRGSTIIVGTQNLPIRSLDGGTTWEEVADGPRGIAAIVHAQDSFVANAQGGIMYRSADNGATWTQLDLTITSGLWKQGETLYSNQFAFSVQESTDGGLTWSPIPVYSLLGFFSAQISPDHRTWLLTLPGTVGAISNDQAQTATAPLPVPVNASGSDCVVFSTNLSNANVFASATCFDANSGLYRQSYDASSVARETPGRPTRLDYDVYPNPVVNQATVRLNLTHPGMVNVEVVDVLGRVRATLHSGILPSGRHAYTWDAHHAPPGLYFIRFRTPNETRTRTVTLLR